MRGKLGSFNECFLKLRITPAHAGKTHISVVDYLGAKDHPRACGENIKTGEYTNADKGSPPRMRGKLGEPTEDESADRITPAHVGKT